MKKIGIISIGGTISMLGDADGLAQVTLGGEDLLTMANYDNQELEYEIFEFKKIPSPHLSLEDLYELRKLILDIAQNQAVEGIVITQGTDTLEETAYFLDITLNLAIPLVITGAQRHPSLPMSDSILNFVEAITVAADSKACEMGVLVVFNSEIIPARDAIKTHKSQVSTFKGVEFGHIGSVTNQRVFWARQPLLHSSYSIKENFTRQKVAIVPTFIGQDSFLIEALLEKGIDGLVIESLGSGHLPLTMLDGVDKTLSQNIPVVLSSRVGQGRFLTNVYGYTGSETHLRSLGVIFGEDLTPAKVRLKLLVLLSNGKTTAQIRHEFEKNFYL